MAAVEAAPSETDGVDPIRVTCLPARDPWNGSDPAWGQGCVNTHPALRPHQGVSEGGRSPPRPCSAQCGTGDRVATNATPSDRTG